MIDLRNSPIDFVTPKAFWLLLILPLWWILRYRWRPPTITFSRVGVIAQGPQGSSWYPKLLFTLRNLMLILLVIVLARPRLAKPTAQENESGIDIELLVDLSGSMLSQDFQPHNRLEVAKKSLRNFIMDRDRRHDRIGLMAFANEAYTVTPLTADHGAVLQDVNNLSVGQLDDGTALGDAIVSAAARVYKAPGKSKVLIVMTDGVNNRGKLDPLTAAKVANTYGIKTYTIGVGKQGMAPVPVPQEDGSTEIVMQPVEIDEVGLADVARITGGQYFRAVDAAGLDRIYHQIDRMEQSIVRATVYAHYAELFRWPLGIAIMLMLMELILAAVRGPIP